MNEKMNITLLNYTKSSIYHENDVNKYLMTYTCTVIY